MPQSLAPIYLHIVFSTREREPFLTDDNVANPLHRYLAGICNHLHCPAIIVGGHVDHVHILCRFGREVTVADLLRDLKRDSSKWIKQQFAELQSFHWQHGYGAFSVSASHVSPVETYIRRQAEHHQTMSYQDEVRRLCQKYGVELDERYAWD